MRRIIHIDMDAFYASVEQRDDPALRGRPLAVGGREGRGVVMAASYEARRFGVRSAMPSITARRLCPTLLFVRPRFDVYKAVSAQVRGILLDYTTLIQPLSLDEAYLDVSTPLRDLGSATAIAQDIRERIRSETGLTASAGVSYNKFLAKLASDHRKPDGLFVITPVLGSRFVEALPIDRFHGIGPVTAAKMRRLGIETGQDLRDRTMGFLQQHFGKVAAHYYGIARGIDDRPVLADRPRKSLGAEHTFSRDIVDLSEAQDALKPAVDRVWDSYSRGGRTARTLTLKVKYADFRIITRAASEVGILRSHSSFEAATMTLLRALHPFRRPLRLLGVSISRYDDEQSSKPIPDLFDIPG